LPTVWHPDHLKILVDREKWSCKKENENKGKMRLSKEYKGKKFSFLHECFSNLVRLCAPNKQAETLL
jgi:hypothetical protein